MFAAVAAVLSCLACAVPAQARVAVVAAGTTEGLLRPKARPTATSPRSSAARGATTCCAARRAPTRCSGKAGADRLLGGAGDDGVVRGGSGRDRINVVRGGIDRVDCGPGRDVVYADPVDHVARSCEDVRR